jgi:hypothetical protein
MPSPLSIICPIGDKYGTVKSHAHGVSSTPNSGVANFGGFDPDIDPYATPPIYTEVTREQWALFALNAKSMNVTAITTAGLSPFTLWRGSRPDASYSEVNNGGYDEKVGIESSPLYLTNGLLHPNLSGVLHFSPLPWIFAGFGINLPNPGTGFRNFYFNPECYILNGKFYLGVRGGAEFLDQSITVNGNIFTYYRRFSGATEIVSDVFEITSTFYPTT